MAIGAQFMCQDFEECMVSVEKAEASGYEYAWFIDSQILWQDVYVYLTSGLDRTERIVFGTAVTNPWTRHVTVTASAFATIAQLHPGRLVLGIGRGDSARADDGHEPGADEAAARLDSDPARPHGRQTVKINDADVHFRWVTEDVGVPICLSATGPEEPPRGRRARRPRDALRRRQPGLRPLGDRSRPGRRRGGRARSGRREVLAPDRRCGSRTTRKRPGRSAAGPPPPVRTTSTTR